MKRVFLAMFVALISICASAQKGTSALGVNLSYGTEIENIGIGVKGQYFLTDALRAEASFDYFLKKDHLSMWDINLNLHYLFEVASNAYVYPLAGIGYTSWKASAFGYSATDNKIAINLGGGFQYDFTETIFFDVEGKYQIIDNLDQFVIGVGVGFKF